MFGGSVILFRQANDSYYVVSRWVTYLVYVVSRNYTLYTLALECVLYFRLWLKVQLVGEKVNDPDLLNCCMRCCLPILIYGRMVSAGHWLWYSWYSNYRYIWWKKLHLGILITKDWNLTKGFFNFIGFPLFKYWICKDRMIWGGRPTMIFGPTPFCLIFIFMLQIPCKHVLCLDCAKKHSSSVCSK